MNTMLGEVRVEYMTSIEIADAIADGARTAILPLGAVEQHGPHLSLSMDADHADELGVRVARGLGDALVLPTVRVGYSPHHLAFAGTISLRASTLEAICEDYGSHLAASGFERLLIFSAHIGNYPVMREFESRLTDKLAPLFVVVFTDGNAILECWRKRAEDMASLGRNVGGHADVAETSVMLTLHPDKVRVDKFGQGYMGAVDEELLIRAFENGVDSISANGVLGNPAGASPLIGEACLVGVTSLIVQHARARSASHA